jgi:translation elongation factor P/translation initiation factor 5A
LPPPHHTAIILDVHKCIYSRSEAKKLLFTNAETGEEVSVRKDMVGPVEAYLKRTQLSSPGE